MPWKKPQPLQSWTDHQWTEWDTEIWTRFKFFQFQWTPGTILLATQSLFTMSTTGPDIVTNACVGLRIGMGLKLTAPSTPGVGLTWDCNVQANDTATIWINNFAAFDQAAPSGLWTLSGVIV
jgi:hypothetical protein